MKNLYVFFLGLCLVLLGIPYSAARLERNGRSIRPGSSLAKRQFRQPTQLELLYTVLEIPNTTFDHGVVESLYQLQQGSREYFLKIFNKESNRTDDLVAFDKEASALWLLKDKPNIVQIVGSGPGATMDIGDTSNEPISIEVHSVWKEPSDMAGAFPWIMVESGDPLSAVQRDNTAKERVFSLETIIKVLGDIAQALKGMQEAEVVPMSISGDTILMDSTLDEKLEAKLLYFEDTSPSSTRNTSPISMLVRTVYAMVQNGSPWVESPSYPEDWFAAFYKKKEERPLAQALDKTLFKYQTLQSPTLDAFLADIAGAGLLASAPQSPRVEKL